MREDLELGDTDRELNKALTEALRSPHMYEGYFLRNGALEGLAAALEAVRGVEVLKTHESSDGKYRQYGAYATGKAAGLSQAGTPHLTFTAVQLHGDRLKRPARVYVVAPASERGAILGALLVWTTMSS